jgi:hypothetical protein
MTPEAKTRLIHAGQVGVTFGIILGIVTILELTRPGRQAPADGEPEQAWSDPAAGDDLPPGADGPGEVAETIGPAIRGRAVARVYSWGDRGMVLVLDDGSSLTMDQFIHFPAGANRGGR